MKPRAALSRHGGFTLIELLVALSIMALMALMSWRGLDAMLRTTQHTGTRSADVLALQAGVAQWVIDLDHLAQTPYAHAVDWDGRVLRVFEALEPGFGERVDVDDAAAASLPVSCLPDTLGGTAAAEFLPHHDRGRGTCGRELDGRLHRGGHVAT